jgi:hypothetical protein
MFFVMVIVSQTTNATLLTVAGYLVHKEYLPVLELHFGDTGTIADEKVGIHKLGKLECTGDGKCCAFLCFLPILFLCFLTWLFGPNSSNSQDCLSWFSNSDFLAARSRAELS